MNAAVIVAAGRGTRFGATQDKLFLEVAGCPIVGHTWRNFDQHPDLHQIVIVVRSSMESFFQDLGRQLSVRKPYEIVLGGAERQDSVWNGLQAIDTNCEVVAIQDGARPCTSSELITACIRTAHKQGAAVAALPLTDTIKSSTDGKTVASHLDRSKLWSVQTPQAFRLDIIRRALAEVRKRGIQVTDDTAACELIGQNVHLVTVNAPNPKVTLPTDLPYVELLLKTPRSVHSIPTNL